MFSTRKLTAEEDEVLKAAKGMPPRVYNLTGTNDPNTLRFFTFGCQGEGGDPQQKVAALLQQLAEYEARHGRKPDFVLILGDNDYNSGMDSPNDPTIQKVYHNVYKELFKQGIPCFIILGNHDHNFHNARLPGQTQGIERAMNEVAHTYLGDATGKFTTTATKEAFFQSKTINLTKPCPQWMMPSRYYVLRVGKVMIFCMDSNTYAKEYRELFPFAQDGDYQRFKPGKGEINQAQWLEDEMRKAKNGDYTVILAQHHPLFTPGKRAFTSDRDTNLYLTSEEIENLCNILNQKLSSEKKLDPTTVSYNDLLCAIFDHQGLKFNAVLCAHDHANYFYNDCQSLCQFTAGGGGGTLQSLLSFINQENLGCYVQDWGFVEVTCDMTQAQPIRFELRTTGGTDLVFLSTTVHSIRKDEKPEVERLRLLVEQACSSYAENLSVLQTQSRGGHLTSVFTKVGIASHGPKGVKRLNEIRAYFSLPAPDNLIDSLNQLHEKIKSSGNEEHSLKTLLDKELIKNIGCTLEELIKNPILIFSPQTVLGRMIQAMDPSIQFKPLIDVKSIQNMDQVTRRTIEEKILSPIFRELVETKSADELFAAYQALCATFPESLLIPDFFIDLCDKFTSGKLNPFVIKMYRQMIFCFSNGMVVPNQFKTETNIVVFKTELTRLINAALPDELKKVRGFLALSENGVLKLRIFDEITHDVVLQQEKALVEQQTIALRY